MSEHHQDATDHALSLCTYCPSLCHHACPIARLQASDTVSPWGMMSLAHHVRHGIVEPSPEIYTTLSACVGCGSCTAVCLHEVDVAQSLVEVKRTFAAAGHAPDKSVFVHAPYAADHPFFEGLKTRSRYEERPTVSLVPGAKLIEAGGELVHTLFDLCERLDVDALACGELARLDPGYDLWKAGHFAAFVEQARLFHAASSGARDIVVMSPETLYLLRDIYPRFGLSIAAELSHVSEFLLPLLSGAFVSRQPGRAVYFESCHLGRHLEKQDIPRQVIKRALSETLVELPTLSGTLGCCGGTGCGGEPTGRVSGRLADEVLIALSDLGVTRLVTFSSECFVSLSGAQARRHDAGLPTPVVEHALTIVSAAVVRDGGAA